MMRYEINLITILLKFKDFWTVRLSSSSIKYMTHTHEKISFFNFLQSLPSIVLNHKTTTRTKSPLSSINTIWPQAENSPNKQKQENCIKSTAQLLSLSFIFVFYGIIFIVYLKKIYVSHQFWVPNCQVHTSEMNLNCKLHCGYIYQSAKCIEMLTLQLELVRYYYFFSC